MHHDTIRHRPARPLALLAGLAILAFLAGCGDDATGPATNDAPESPDLPGPPATVVLSSDTVRLDALGAVIPLSATVADSNGIALGNPTVAWSSADEAVATVDDAGRVKAVGAGETEVTATAGDASDAAAVIVDQAPVSLALRPSAADLHALDDTVRFSATVRDANAHAIPDAAVDWTTADTTIATVDSTGFIAATGAGRTDVVASAGGASAAASVLVTTPSAASISVSPVLSEIAALGDSVRLSATVRDAHGSVMEDATVAWSSGDESVATVDADGWALAQANGTATITAAAGGVSDDAAVRVEQAVASVSISPAIDTLALHELVPFSATAADANDVAIPGATVIWSASDPDAATVDGAGNVTAVGWGVDVTIAATADGVSGTADVHVLDQLAFMSARDGNQEVYLMNADGSGQTRLTFEGSADQVPAWSPDGTQIAFTSFRTGNAEIWVMDADGTNARNLTDDPAADHEPTWSPDGSRIAFRSFRDGNHELYTMNVDGSDVTRLTVDGGTDRDAAWSPDGSQIAFASTRDPGDGTTDYDIYLMDANGSNVTALTSHGSTDRMPAWSPDGSQIAFRSFRDGNAEIYVMDSDGSNPTRLTNDGAGDREPAWSPDGSRIAFASNRGGGFDIWIMDADGSDAARLGFDPAGGFEPVWRPRP